LIEYKTDDMEKSVNVLYRKPKWYNVVYDPTGDV